MKFYQCMPSLQVSADGPIEINGEDATDNTRACVTFGHHLVDIYLDHDETIGDLDDVVRFPAADLPPVSSPIKPMKVIKPVAEEAEFMFAVALLKKKEREWLIWMQLSVLCLVMIMGMEMIVKMQQIHQMMPVTMTTCQKLQTVTMPFHKEMMICMSTIALMQKKRRGTKNL